MTLRYPQDMSGLADYIQFKPLEYRANSAAVRGRQGGRGAAASDGQDVVLYMPNSTPSVGNINNWGPTGGAFTGPIGELDKMMASGAVNVIQKQKDLDIRKTINNLKEEFQAFKDPGKGLGGPALRQFGMQFVPQLASGMSGAQLMAMTHGKVYNPNVELLYTAPGMRPFNMVFTFVPKNAGEASTVNQIIKNFKKWSAPDKIDNGMLKVPHVWQVTYMTSGGQENQNMNKFKLAACTSVTVQANPGTSMHVAHEDGMPIETVLSLSFQEVDIIVREDHDEGNQGF